MAVYDIEEQMAFQERPCRPVIGWTIAGCLVGLAGRQIAARGKQRNVGDRLSADTIRLLDCYLPIRMTDQSIGRLVNLSGGVQLVADTAAGASRDRLSPWNEYSWNNNIRSSG